MRTRFSSSEPMKARFGIPKPPSGTRDISENDVYDVAEFRFANVNVPVPPGYLIPAGTKNISTNGTHDVAEFANAAVAIPYNVFGEDAELVQTYDLGTVKLSATGYASWTPSTTATTIKASSNIGTITASDLDTYEYLQLSRFVANTTYISGTTLKAAVIKQVIELAQVAHRKPSNFTNLTSKTDNNNYGATLFTANLMDYYNASGTHTLAWTGGYGFYPSASGPSFASTTTANTTITIKSPAYNARCSNTYFSTTMAGKVDQDKSTISCVVYVYRMKKHGLLWTLYHDTVEEYNK